MSSNKQKFERKYYECTISIENLLMVLPSNMPVCQSKLSYVLLWCAGGLGVWARSSDGGGDSSRNGEQHWLMLLCIHSYRLRGGWCRPNIFELKVEWRDYYNTYMSVYWECVRRHIKYWNYRVKYTRTHNIRRTIPFFDIKQVDSNYIFIKWKWMAHDVHVHVCTERVREKGMHVILICCFESCSLLIANKNNTPREEEILNVILFKIYVHNIVEFASFMGFNWTVYCIRILVFIYADLSISTRITSPSQ